MMRIPVTSETAIVAVCDPSVSLPSGMDQDALVRELEPMAREGEVFYVVADDPLQCEVGLVVGEPPPAELALDFEPSGGTFGLALPTGQVAVHGWTREGAPVVAGSATSAPGVHVLSALVRRPFDAERHAQHMTALLGSDWRFMQRVDKLALVGCLPLAATAIAVVAQRWLWLAYLLPLLALTWLPHFVLRLTSRYKLAERKSQELEQRCPALVLSVVPTDQRGLAGGFLRV